MTEEAVSEFQQKETVTAPKILTYDDFRNAYPDIQGSLFGSAERYKMELDGGDVAAKYDADEELKKYEIFFNWCGDMSKNTVKNGKQNNREGGSKLGKICSRIRKTHFADALCVFAFRCGKPAIGLPAANKKQIDM